MDEGGLGPLVSNTWPPLNATECNWMHLDAPSVLAKPSWDSPESISESNETSKLKMWHKDMIADLSSRWSYFTSVDPGIPFSCRVAVAVNEFLRAEIFRATAKNLCSLIGNRSRSMMLTWSCITIAQLLITKRSSDLNSTSLLTWLKLDTLGVWVLNMIRLEKIYSTTKSQSPFISPWLHGINMYQPLGDATSSYHPTFLWWGRNSDQGFVGVWGPCGPRWRYIMLYHVYIIIIHSALFLQFLLVLASKIFSALLLLFFAGNGHLSKLQEKAIT